MTATLHVILEQLRAERQSAVSRYAKDLTAALVSAAPRNCIVDGFVSAPTSGSDEPDPARVPGINELQFSQLSHRDLVRAWKVGIGTRIAAGMVHAPDLLAPLHKHDRRYDSGQTVVTVHSTLPWTHPKSLPAADVSWSKTMLKRARKYADAIVVPSHTIARSLGGISRLGDRVRVIEHAVSPRLALPMDAEWRAQRLALPERYILAQGNMDPRRGIDSVIEALRDPTLADLELLVVGGEPHGDATLRGAIDAAGVDGLRVRALGRVSDSDLAVLYDRAQVFVHPSTAVGFGLPVLEAFLFNTPVVISDDPALVEVAGGAAEVAEISSSPAGEALAAAIIAVTTDRERRAELIVRGADRTRAFSWSLTAEQIWQLHADI